MTRQLRLHIGIRICNLIGSHLDGLGMLLFGDRWIGSCVLFHDTSAPDSWLIR